ncbi:MAG: hypothetical protein JNM47_10365 [Hyphomonadaceae bacterium]|nr:hypothetical protein [Hyphomonadaceae bacterium]
MTRNLYCNPRAWRARIAQAAIWLGVVAIGAIPFTTPSITPQETLIAYLFVALAVAAAVGVEIYLRRYVSAIDADANGVVFTTLTTFGRKQIRHGRGEIRHAGRRHDKARFGAAPSVDNHWIALHTAAGKFAFVLDVTPPATMDDDALRKALG